MTKENSFALSKKLNEIGFRPGAVVRHKRSGDAIRVARVYRGKVYTSHDGIGRSGWVQDYEVVEPNFYGPQEYFGRHSITPNDGRRRRWW